MSNNTGIEGLAAYREKVASGEIEPAQRGNQWTRFEAQNTRRTAIEAMCVRCMGWDQGEERPAGVMETIRECTDVRCPLHAWRPYR